MTEAMSLETAMLRQIDDPDALLQAVSKRKWRPRDPATKAMALRLYFDMPVKLSQQQIADAMGRRRDTIQPWCKAEADRGRVRKCMVPSGPGEYPGMPRQRKPRKRFVVPRRKLRYPAYDAATMAVAQHPFSWKQADRRLVGVPYSEQAVWPVVVVLGVGDDGHVHLFWEDNNLLNGSSIARNIQQLHREAPVDAVVHTPPQAPVHSDIAIDLKDWPLRTFSLNPHTPGADLRPHLTRRLEAGRFTLHTTLCPKTHAELQAAARPADHPHPEGPFVLALCTVLEYLDQQAAA